MHPWLPRIPASLSCLFLLVMLLPAQVQNPQIGQKSQQPGKTIRVNVALVQTDVMVLDHDGHFVDNLKPEQFEFRVDGKATPISFFDLVYAGTPHDEEIWAKMGRKESPAAPVPPASHSNVGRTILFFIDDWHLSAESIMRAKTALQKLIEDSVGVNDQAALVAASGQLGFLQQFTNDKAVLRAAANKLAGGSVVEDLMYPAMNEAHAARIVQGDTNLEDYFVCLLCSRTGESCRTMPPPPPNCLIARRIIRDRVKALSNVSAEMAERTLSALRDFVRSASLLPGRKLIFFLSDGFALQLDISDIADRLWRLTTAAANKGIVIYTLDTRGLMTGMPDAKSNLPPPVGTTYDSVMDFQDGLNALAADTGGRFLKNTNALDIAISTAMAEASRYYLLGWYVDTDLLKPGKYWSLHVSVKDRPDLNVRLRAGLVDLSQSVPIQQNKPVKPASSPKDAADQLKHALEAPFQMDELPVSVHAGWILDPAQGPTIALSYQVDADAVKGAETVSAEVISAVGNKDGVAVDKFSETLSRPGGTSRQASSSRVALKYGRMVHLDPGLYQVRVAARDPVSGKLGSAWQWVDVPTPEKGKIQLSSIFLREQNDNGPTGISLNADTLNRAQFNVQRRFSADVQVSFYANVYNASGPDIEIQTTIFQGNKPIVEAPAQSISAKPSTPDLNTVPVIGTLTFNGLAPGSYVLQVAVTDRHGNTTVTQRVPFWIQ